VLIMVPPSETKRPPAASGRPLVLDELSFPSLLPTRRQVADALIRTSADPDAFERLHVGPAIAPQVVRNIHLFELPAIPVLDLYTGPLHDGLDAAGWSAAACERAGDSLVVVSPLWGTLRPTDRIPPYRLNVWANLIGIDRLDHTWRAVLPDVLAQAAGDTGVVLDIRSPMDQAMGYPTGLGDRTVILKVDQGPPGNRLGDVISKRLRGAAARHLLESGADPAGPHELVDVLGDRWPVRLASPERPGRPWTIMLSID
jgi:uncharacterized protein